jgi:hypothetical protein
VVPNQEPTFLGQSSGNFDYRPGLPHERRRDDGREAWVTRTLRKASNVRVAAKELVSTVRKELGHAVG